MLSLLQVSGDAFLQCLKMALDAAPTMHQALQVRVARACCAMLLSSVLLIVQSNVGALLHRLNNMAYYAPQLQPS